MTIESTAKIDPNVLARRVGELMFSKDRVAHRLGINMGEIGSGYSRMTMKVTQDMINGHDICHGGYICLFTDTACAYACNSHNDNTLSQAVNIVFLAPATLGETLVAEAVESAHEGRTGIYEIKIRTESDRIIAVAQVQCRNVNGRVLEEFPSAKKA